MHGTRRISADTALRLSRFSDMSDGFWMNLQGYYDIEIEKDRLGATLADIEPLADASRSRAASSRAHFEIDHLRRRSG